MSGLFDHRQVRRAFSRSAGGYSAAAALQHEVEARLLDSLDYLDDPNLGRSPPQVVVDLGCGPGTGAAAMRKRWPRAQVIAMDMALPMLRETRQIAGWWRPFVQVCADARALPLAEGSVDVLFSNLCLQWVEDLPAVFAGFRRVLKPGGMLLVSTFGSDTLYELRDAFGNADQAPHVSPFVPAPVFADALVHAGFRDPVLDRDVFVHRHRDLPALMRELRMLGATNALSARRQTLTGKARFATAAAAYVRDSEGLLPATWETIYAQAWAPAPGAPIREQGFELASFPASSIPVRRR